MPLPDGSPSFDDIQQGLQVIVKVHQHEAAIAELQTAVRDLEELVMAQRELREKQAEVIRKAMDALDKYAARLGIDVEHDDLLDSIDDVLADADQGDRAGEEE